jgi:uncharacterized protein YebE (UPF0316 family)
VRLIILARQQKILAASMGFVEVLIFALTMGVVVNDLGNILNLLAYAGGFSVGSYVGMWIEAQFITSYMTVNIITHEKGHELAMALREAGFGVTETHGEGKDGAVTVLRSVVINRNVRKLVDVVQRVHPEAFISVEEARPLRRGWLRGVRTH